VIPLPLLALRIASIDPLSLGMRESEREYLMQRVTCRDSFQILDHFATSMMKVVAYNVFIA